MASRSGASNLIMKVSESSYSKFNQNAGKVVEFMEKRTSGLHHLNCHIVISFDF